MKISYLLLCLFIQSWLCGQDRYSVLITEIMADPTPVVNLPGNEWIELKNVSAIPVNLQGWRIGDAANLSGPLPYFLLQPDSIIVVCPASALPAMLALGPAIPLSSFPSLDNDGELLFLRTANGSSIHAVEYDASWYGNDIKKGGGWTLEMIDPAHPCAGSANWKASNDASGGTPGRKNSTESSLTDTDGPMIIKAYTTDSLTIIIVFDEPVDSLSGTIASQFVITGGPAILHAEPLAPIFREIRLVTSAPLTVNTIYPIGIAGVKDCMGNQVVPGTFTKTGIPSLALPGDCIINEILFNPRSNGYDYVEIYNNSDKIIDLALLIVANRSFNGSIGSPVSISGSPRYLFPSDHVVLTENVNNLALNYFVKEPGQVAEISLPSFPDTEGTVIILNSQGEIMDEVRYKDDWHFKLISEPEGIALERIDPNASSVDPANWHSAASTAGYGTPGYKNSQFRGLPVTGEIIRIEPKLFSPDNDGRDDITSILYRVDEQGYMGSITIFDSRGLIIRHLVRNALMGISGYWNWDGLDDKGKKLPAGVYIVFAEIFNLEGKVVRVKRAVVLARSF